MHHVTGAIPQAKRPLILPSIEKLMHAPYRPLPCCRRIRYTFMIFVMPNASYIPYSLEVAGSSCMLYATTAMSAQVFLGHACK